MEADDMAKNDREKEWKATASIHNSYDDINNLNDSEDFAPIVEQEEVKTLSDEEKIEVRKKLFVLLVLIILALLFMLVMLIFDPFKSNNKKEETPKEENNPTQKEEVKTDQEKSISELNDGLIINDNIELNSITKEIIYQKDEYYDNDTLALFKTNQTKISSLTDLDKLFLVSKTNEFNTLVKEKNTKNDICNSNITISTSEIQKILTERFNTSVKEYVNFNYSYYDNGNFISNIKFTIKDNNYVGTCYKSKEKISSVSEQQFVSATKEKNNLYIDVRIVFINSKGVYKDPTLKTLITNDVKATSNDYMPKGNIYRYLYTYNNGKYVLQGVQLLK